MTSEVKMREAFAAKYQRDPDDPASAEMLAVFSDGWEAARVEARTWEARYAELRSLIDRRPAMNAGLIEAYAKWTGQCGLVDFLNALDVASDDAGKEAP